MTALVAPKTNGDVIQPFVDRGRALAVEAFEHFKAHPDELAVGVAPLLMMATATRRHKLNFAEAALVAEVGFWCGVFAVRAYRDWKDRPVGEQPRLRKVE
jgi:hypothetical protein